MVELKECLLTGIPVKDGVANLDNIDKYHFYRYWIKTKNKEIPVRLCTFLFKYLLENDIENPFVELLNENRVVFIGELAKTDFESLRTKIFHASCDVKDRPGNFRIRDYIDGIIRKGSYPISRREKYENLLRYLYLSQPFEGGEIQIFNRLDFYSKLYFKSFEELQFFLREIQRKDYVTYIESRNVIQFTFFGLENFDTMKTAGEFDISINGKQKFDIGLSFAGENRAYVEKVAFKLQQLGVSVFYDAYEQVDLWGKDLYQHLNDIYKNKCRYCIIFISRYYAEKLWTKHELKAAQAKAFNENKEYILPVRFDNTEVPGINSTTGYLDCSKTSPEQIALLAFQKIKNS